MALKDYSDEFRADAVALYESTPGATYKSIAADLGSTGPPCVSGCCGTANAAASPPLPRLRAGRQRPGPGRKYTSDITYLPLAGGEFLYLATVLDCFSRKVVGWSIADHMRTGLVADALQMAASTRGGLDGAVYHSDSEYVECWMSPGFLARTATDARGYRCRDAPRPPDPHSDRPRCPSSDLSVARGIPARHPPRRRPPQPQRIRTPTPRR